MCIRDRFRIMCMAGKCVPRRLLSLNYFLLFSVGFTSLESMCKGFPLHFGGPHLTGGVGGQCITTIISVATPHRDYDGLYASPSSLRLASPHRDVDGLCLATIISMDNTSDGCRRVIYFAAWEGRGGQRCPHCVQMIEPLIV